MSVLLCRKASYNMQAGDHIQPAEAGKEIAPATQSDVPATKDGLPATGDSVNSIQDDVPSTSYGSTVTESNTRWDAKKRAVKVIGNWGWLERGGGRGVGAQGGGWFEWQEGGGGGWSTGGRVV